MAVWSFLEALVEREGLSNFMEWYFADFNASVGHAWAQGELAIHAEHHYSETLRKVVYKALSALPRKSGAARILLTTPPNEIHGLGLLGVEATLALRGAECLCLGMQTPVPDVVQAAIGFRVCVVAISISDCYNRGDAGSYVLVLRKALPAEIRLWVGGMGARFLAEMSLDGVDVFEHTADAAEAWNSLFDD
jgi:methylmalonyl-CoA mutase cobalamin-binding subunit